ncbi:MAG: hypothetical protein ACLU84_06185 [Clostridia bacterium]
MKQASKGKYKRKKLSMAIGIIITFGIFSYSLACYMQQVKGTSQVGILKPIMEVRGEQSILISGIEPINTYHFSVRNYNEQGLVNEAQMDYQIEIICPVEEGMQIQLWEGEDQILLENNKTTFITLENKQKEEKNYTLQVAYQKEQNLQKDDIEENIEIKIHSIQRKVS